MKVKEANLTANIVWSPSSVTPTYLACGTSAQQLDASFNSSSVIQVRLMFQNFLILIA